MHRQRICHHRGIVQRSDTHPINMTSMLEVNNNLMQSGLAHMTARAASPRLVSPRLTSLIRLDGPKLGAKIRSAQINTHQIKTKSCTRAQSGPSQASPRTTVLNPPCMHALVRSLKVSPVSLASWARTPTLRNSATERKGSHSDPPNKQRRRCRSVAGQTPRLRQVASQPRPSSPAQ